MLVATGNAAFNGRRIGATACSSSAGATGRLLRQLDARPTRQQLDASDGDLGKTTPGDPARPAPRPAASRCRAARTASRCWTRSLTARALAGGRLGGELSGSHAPGHGPPCSPRSPCATARARTTCSWPTTPGQPAYRLGGGKLHRRCGPNGTGGTSPVLAGGVLYVFDPVGGLEGLPPATGAADHRCRPGRALEQPDRGRRARDPASRQRQRPRDQRGRRHLPPSGALSLAAGRQTPANRLQFSIHAGRRLVAAPPSLVASRAV